MSDPNVKLTPKASVAPPEQTDVGKNETDTYHSGPRVSTAPEWGPGNSGYSPANAKTTQWSRMFRGAITPGIPNENLIEPLMPMVENLDKNMRNYGTEPYIRGYIPRNKFEQTRLFFEDPNIATVEDLKKDFRPIPKFSEIYKEIKNYDYIRNFYTNRLGMINELMEHTKYELENNTNPDILSARKEFEIFLKEQKMLCEKQLTQCEKTAISNPEPNPLS